MVKVACCSTTAKVHPRFSKVEDLPRQYPDGAKTQLDIKTQVRYAFSRLFTADRDENLISLPRSYSPFVHAVTGPGQCTTLQLVYLFYPS